MAWYRCTAGDSDRSWSFLLEADTAAEAKSGGEVHIATYYAMYPEVSVEPAPWADPWHGQDTRAAADGVPGACTCAGCGAALPEGSRSEGGRIAAGWWRLEDSGDGIPSTILTLWCPPCWGARLPGTDAPR